MPSTLYSWIMNNQGLELRLESQPSLLPLQSSYCFHFGHLSTSHTSQKQLVSILLSLCGHSAPCQIHQPQFHSLSCFPLLSHARKINVYVALQFVCVCVKQVRKGILLLCTTKLMTIILAYDSRMDTVTTGYRKHVSFLKRQLWAQGSVENTVRPCSVPLCLFPSCRNIVLKSKGWKSNWTLRRGWFGICYWSFDKQSIGKLQAQGKGVEICLSCQGT